MVLAHITVFAKLVLSVLIANTQLINVIQILVQKVQHVRILLEVIAVHVLKADMDLSVIVRVSIFIIMVLCNFKARPGDL